MRVLYLCHRIPYPPSKGDKIRAFHQIEAIGAAHEVDVFTLTDEPEDPAARQALARHCRRLTVARLHPRAARLRALPYLCTRQPLTLPYFHSTELKREIQNAILARSYDRIFVYCSAMAQYIEPDVSIPVIADFVDVDSDKWTQYAAFARFPFSWLYRREGDCLREGERRICNKAACVMVSTEREAELLRRISPAGHIQVIPNGVDADYFRPPAVSPDFAGRNVIFTGDMAYFPNQEAVTYFAQRVLPAIRRSVPDVRFFIVGRNPSRGVLRLQKIVGVEVTGFVPDVRAYFAKARVAVAPFSIAAGIQNKILEAMAYGLPVVATSRAAQGLSRPVAEMLEVGDTAEEMAAKIIALLTDTDGARRKGMECRHRVTSEYRWDRALPVLLRLLENPKADSVEAKHSLV